MADQIQFKHVATTGNNKPVRTLEEGLRTIAECNPCGCDNRLGYWTTVDVSTGDTTLMYVSNGTILTANLNDGTLQEWIDYLGEMCKFREGLIDEPFPPGGG